MRKIKIYFCPNSSCGNSIYGLQFPSVVLYNIQEIMWMGFEHITGFFSQNEQALRKHMKGKQQHRNKCAKYTVYPNGSAVTWGYIIILCKQLYYEIFYLGIPYLNGTILLNIFREYHSKLNAGMS